MLHYLSNTPPHPQGSVRAGAGGHGKHPLGAPQMPDLHSRTLSLRVICVSCVPVAVVCGEVLVISLMSIYIISFVLATIKVIDISSGKNNINPLRTGVTSYTIVGALA